VQVDPIKPMLKPTGTKRLKLNCDILLSTSAFKLKLRRYSKAEVEQLRLGLGRGLHSLPSKLNLRTFGITSRQLELNVSTFGPRPPVNLGCTGDKVSLS